MITTLDKQMTLDRQREGLTEFNQAGADKRKKYYRSEYILHEPNDDTPFYGTIYETLEDAVKNAVLMMKADPTVVIFIEQQDWIVKWVAGTADWALSYDIIDATVLWESEALALAQQATV